MQNFSLWLLKIVNRRLPWDLSHGAGIFIWKRTKHRLQIMKKNKIYSSFLSCQNRKRHAVVKCLLIRCMRKTSANEAKGWSQHHIMFVVLRFEVCICKRKFVYVMTRKNMWICPLGLNKNKLKTKLLTCYLSLLHG